MRVCVQLDDEDADAMATGRLDPDLCICVCLCARARQSRSVHACVRIYLFNIPFACAPRRRGRLVCA